VIGRVWYDTAYYIAYIEVITAYHSTSIQPFPALSDGANRRRFVRRADAARLAGIAVDLLAGAVVVIH
jgi:hypothetical protein